MDPITSLSQLTELLRKRIATEATAKRGGSIRAAAARNGGAAERVPLDRLRDQIVDSVRGLDPDDPARTTKAARVFVESVLTWQFGADVLNDPGFAELVGEVSGAMERDPAANAAMAALFSGR